jgi:hypothetical protein
MASQKSVGLVVKGNLVWLLLLHVACARHISGTRGSGSDFALRLVPPGPRDAEARALADFLVEITSLLPAQLKAALSQEIAVSFDGPGEPLRPPSCHDTTSPPELELAKVDSSDEKRLHIVLHGGFVAVIRAGPAQAAHYPCGHRSMYRLAQAALLHKVLHAYDERRHLSVDRQYQNLHRFAPQGLFRRIRSRNELAQRSPDAYEFGNPKESFAVHGEYFLLDPDYRCRLPASYRFFARAFAAVPFPNAACQPRTIVYDGVEPIDIDPSRVQAVHYLWASEGRGAQSRFGHAMLRLVICARERPKVDASCELDVQDHVVLSFAANMHGSLRIEALKGLLGGYKSQLFVRALPEVIIDYTERQLRDLYSFPLQLSRSEIDALVLRVLEVFWSYSGRYYFLTNNCATETLSLLRAVLPEARSHPLSALTPRGIRDVLIANQLTQPLPPSELAALEARGLFFPSAKQGYELAYRRLRGASGVHLPRSMLSYLEHTSATQRRALFAQRVEPQRLSDLYALEGMVHRRRQHLMMAKLLKLYLQAERRGQHPTLRKKVAQLIARGELHQPWLWPRGGYGVPLPADVVDVPAPLPSHFLTALRGEVMQLIAAQLAPDHQELVRTEENQRWLATQLLQKVDARQRSTTNTLYTQGATERRQL